MNVPAILAVARNTWKESARNRVLYALVGATVLVSGLSYVLAAVAATPDVTGIPRRLQIVADISLSAIALLGALCAIFLGTNLVYVEVERRTVYTILARPIGRGEFVLGKFLGLAAVVLAATAVMAVGFAGIYCLYGGASAAAGIATISWHHLVAIGFTALELVVVVAIALFFSVVAHPIEGAIFSFVVTLAAHTTGNLNAFGADLTRVTAGETPSAGAVIAAKALWVLYVLLPNLENLNFRAQAVYGTPIKSTDALFAALHAGLYIVILLVLAVLAFRKKIL
jgi:ABC-type transport system involved in multi-copper enzyme maturation permease subunit